MQLKWCECGVLDNIYTFLNGSQIQQSIDDIPQQCLHRHVKVVENGIQWKSLPPKPHYQKRKKIEGIKEKELLQNMQDPSSSFIFLLIC